jgi:DDE superfamily endonuclease
MVSVAVSSMGRSQIHFFKPGVKINGEYYHNVVLKGMLLPDIRSVSGDSLVFQPDGAPAHRARDTVELLRMDTRGLITPELWPPNSPDLNPMDYSVWSVKQKKVYRTRIADIDELKQRLLQVWVGLDHGFITAAIGQRRRRLSACVKAWGGHFEHPLR